MRRQTAILSAAALLLGGVATASAATATQQPQQQPAQQSQAQQPAASAAAGQRGTDTIILSAAQRKSVLDDLSKQASNQSASGFEGQIGTFVPNTVKLEPMPSNVTANNSSLGAYNFAMVNNKLLIVDPSNKVVADVLSPETRQAQEQQPQNQASQAQQPASAAAGQHGTDTVILSAAQRKAVWNDLSKQASNQSASGVEGQIGTFVPNTVKLEPMPSNVTADNSSLGAYNFAMVNNKLLIVDPSNKVVADVLSAETQQAQERQPQNQQSRAQYPNNQQVAPNNANESAQNSEQTISPKTLSRGNVRQVQQALDKNGFQVGRVDGRWGPKTSDAMKQFQQSKKIKANGQLDQRTLSDLGFNGAQFAQQNQNNSR